MKKKGIVLVLLLVVLVAGLVFAETKQVGRSGVTVTLSYTYGSSTALSGAVRYLIKNNNPYSVAVEFEVHGQYYQISRSRGGGNGTKKVQVVVTANNELPGTIANNGSDGGAFSRITDLKLLSINRI